MIACVSSASGWGTYAHYVSATGLSNQANLADYWGTSFERHWSKGYADIVPLFPWTHGCLRNGRTGVFVDAELLQIPRTPTNYKITADRKAPEDDMLLLASMMTTAHQAAALLLETGRGFRAHNRLDSAGHFTLFPGGGLDEWAQHALLEKLAEYIVWEEENGMDLESGGEFVESVQSSGHAGIILLAQKAFRKARHSIDSTMVQESERQPLSVGSLSAIASSITWSKTLRFRYSDKNQIELALLPFMTEAQVNQWEEDLHGNWSAYKAGAQ
jgi:hypothetical protein